MRTKKEILILGILAFVAILLALNSFGVIGLNLYKSNVGTNESSTLNLIGERSSYNVSFEYEGKPIYEHAILKDGQPQIPVNMTIEKHAYSGNYFLPFYKKFSVKYGGKLSTNRKADSQTIQGNGLVDGDVNGEVTGELHAEIIGFCTMRKAREIAETHALESIKKYVIVSLDK